VEGTPLPQSYSFGNFRCRSTFEQDKRWNAFLNALGKPIAL